MPSPDLRVIQSVRTANPLVGAARFVRDRVKLAILRRFFAGTTDAYLRPNDLIAQGIMIRGEYEPELNAVIEHLAQTHRGFLIDIGANVGLISMRHWQRFDRVICIEPNPTLVPFLSGNLALVGATNATILPFGIGDRDEAEELTMPRHNIGGSFVRRGNRYDDSVLTMKDGFSRISTETHRVLPIALRKGSTVFRELFAELPSAGLVKIDVEGMESTVLRHLFDALPTTTDIAVCFENWDVLPRAEIDALTGGRGRHIYQLLTPAYRMRPARNKYQQFLRDLIGAGNVSLYDLSDAPMLYPGDVILSTRALSTLEARNAFVSE